MGKIKDLTGEIRKPQGYSDVGGGYADIFKCVWRPLKPLKGFITDVCTFFSTTHFYSSYDNTRSPSKSSVVTVNRRVKRVTLRR